MTRQILRTACWLLLLPQTILVAQEAEQKSLPAKQVRLPAELEGPMLAGRGDFLVVSLPSLQKLAIVDLKQEKVSGYLSLEEGSFAMTGVADGLILYYPDKQTLQRWSLAPLEVKQTANIGKLEVTGLYSGCACSGPFMVMTTSGPQFFDTSLLRPFKGLEGRVSDDWKLRQDHDFKVSTSADATTFAMSVDGTPTHISILQIQASKLIEQSYSGGRSHWLLPSPDGSLMFESHDLYNTHFFQPLPRKQLHDWIFPTIHPAFYVGVSGVTVNGVENIELCTTHDRQPLLSLTSIPGLKGPRGLEEFFYSYMYRRIFVNPALNKAVVIDGEFKSVHLVSIDIPKALKEKKEDYLLLDSLPVISAVRGKDYVYPIRTLSKSGNVTFSLGNGPKGMTIDAKGVLSWAVPADFSDPATSVVVSISDGSKQHAYHAFQIYVAPLDPAK